MRTYWTLLCITTGLLLALEGTAAQRPESGDSSKIEKHVL